MDTMFFDDMVLRHTKGVKYAMKKKTMEKFEKLNEHNEVYEVPVAMNRSPREVRGVPICCTLRSRSRRFTTPTPARRAATARA